MPMPTTYQIQSVLHIRHCKPALQLVSTASIFLAD